MIDWITMVVPCSHNQAIHDGRVIKTQRDGSVQFDIGKRLSVKGSHDAGITIRTVSPPSASALVTSHNVYTHSHIQISGNPVKWLQGHNLWGTDDLSGLILDTIYELFSRSDLGLTPTPEEIAAWHAGNIHLTRVDITNSFRLPKLSDVLAWLRAAELTARVRKGRGNLLEGSTLYFNKPSTYWEMKMYAKGQEIHARGHEQPAIMNLPHVLEWADGILRTELTMKSRRLKDLGLQAVTAWMPLDSLDGVVFDPQSLLREQLGNMTMTTKNDLPETILNTLTNSQRLAFEAWKNGADLRQIISKAAFYKLRSKILTHDIDIATLQPKEISNVVPLVRILEAVPAGIPDWAIGTSLYYEPKRRVNAA